MQTYTLVVIEARPEEGGGGAVHATLLSNCATVLLKVHAHSGRWRVVVLMQVGDRWTGARRRWRTRMCHWSWWGRRTRCCRRARVQVALEDYQAVVNGFRASLEHVRVGGSQAEERVRQELHDAEVALRWSKVKDYYKILAMCAVGFIAVQC